eukprot:6180476-Pleurochrysis_carterae.AAC.2
MCVLVPGCVRAGVRARAGVRLRAGVRVRAGVRSRPGSKHIWMCEGERGVWVGARLRACECVFVLACLYLDACVRALG